MKRLALALVAVIAVTPLAAFAQGGTASDPAIAGGAAGAGTTSGSGGQSGAPAPADIDIMRQAEQQLKAAGFDPGAIDGFMDQQTAQALREYQQSKGLQVTGRLDDATRGALLLGPGTSSGTGSGADGGSSGGGSGSTQAPSSGSSGETGSQRPRY